MTTIVDGKPATAALIKTESGRTIETYTFAKELDDQPCKSNVNKRAAMAANQSDAQLNALEDRIAAVESMLERLASGLDATLEKLLGDGAQNVRNVAREQYAEHVPYYVQQKKDGDTKSGKKTPRKSTQDKGPQYMPLPEYGQKPAA